MHRACLVCGYICKSVHSKSWARILTSLRVCGRLACHPGTHFCHVQYGGLATLQKAIVLDSVGNHEAAQKLYKSIATHGVAQVRGFWAPRTRIARGCRSRCAYPLSQLLMDMRSVTFPHPCIPGCMY